MNPIVLDNCAGFLERKLRRDHIGEDNAATAAELTRYLNEIEPRIKSARDLRDVIHYMRHKCRLPVISTYSGHYSWPAGPDDDAVAHCVSQFLAAGSDMIDTAAAIEDGMAREFGDKPAEPLQLNLLEAI